MESSTYFPRVSNQVQQVRHQAVGWITQLLVELKKSYQQRPILTVILGISSFWPLAIYTGVSVSLLTIGLAVLTGIAVFFGLIVFCLAFDFVLVASLCTGYMAFLIFGCALGLRSLQMSAAVLSSFRTTKPIAPADNSVQSGFKPMKTVKTL